MRSASKRIPVVYPEAPNETKTKAIKNGLHRVGMLCLKNRKILLWKKPFNV